MSPVRHPARRRTLLPLALLTATVLGTATAPAYAASPPVPADLESATIVELGGLLAGGQTTSAALTQAYLQRISALSYGGPKLNAVRSINPNALADTRAADTRLRSGRPHGPMLGIPVLIKDNIDAVGMATTAGSVALANSFPDSDAPLVTALKAAGAVVLGKANLTEFANYLTSGMPAGYSSLGGQVVNAYDPTFSPSGSSAGPGVAASIGLAAATVGSETSGSILSPSVANSDVGIKPTVGLISRTGVVPISSTQDTAGPMTRTVADAAATLTALTSADQGDRATAGNPLLGHDFSGDLSTTALQTARIGVVAVTRTCLTTLCDGAGGVPRAPGATTGGDYADSASRPTNASGPLYDRALAAFTAQGATLVPITLKIPFVTNPGPPGVLSYDFKKDLNAYLSRLPDGAPQQTLDDIVKYNEAHKVDPNALMYGQTLAIASNNLNLDDPKTKQTFVANRQRDIAQSKTVIDQTMTDNNVSALLFSGSGSAGIGAKAQYPSIALPAGFYAATGSTVAQRPYGVTLLGQAYTEPRLVAYGSDWEAGTLYRRPPSQVNPAFATPTPAIPELPLAALLPLAGLGVGGLWLRRRRADSARTGA